MSKEKGVIGKRGIGRSFAKEKIVTAGVAVIGLASLGNANASVTLYGIVDGGVGYTHTSGTFRGKHVDSSVWGSVSGVENGSRWGLKGSENLGNGLSAIFRLESGFDPDTGTSAQGGRLFGRQATVGLKDRSWGQIEVGRQMNMASKYIGAFSPFGLSFRDATAGATFQSAHAYRADNLILYQTPNLGGVRFGIGYSWNADGGISGSSADGSQLDNNGAEFTTGIRYTNGPVDVTAAYDLLKVGSNVAGNDNNGGGTNVQEWHIGGSYDFDVVKGYLAFGQMRNGVFGDVYYELGPNGKAKYKYVQPVMNGFRANSYEVGLSAPVGHGVLLASWQLSTPRDSSDRVKKEYGVTGDLTVYSVGYKYHLSKRTDLYTVASYTDHAQYQDDLRSTDLAVGVRHMF